MPIRVALALLFTCAIARADEAPPQPVLTKAPKLRQFVEADYPAAARAAGLTAQVVLTIDIDAQGGVVAVSVAESGGAAFDAAAVAAAQNFVFDPAEVDGRPAPVRIAYRYSFTITSEPAAPVPQVNLEGTVVERFSKRPLAGVTVHLVEHDRSTTTGEDGRFAFVDVPSGEHHVQLTGERLIPVTTIELLAAGEKHSVSYQVEARSTAVDEEEVVRAPRLRRESVVTTLRSAEARRVPGTQGDTLKVVQSLPGVARSSAGSGQIVVWGAAPRDTRVIVDGVEIPALYHIGGLRSTVNSDLVQSVDLIPGAYGAEYGRALGGLVRVETRPLQSAGVHGYLAADLLDASAMVSVAAGKRFRIAAAGRYSLLDRILGGVVSPDVGDFFPLPRYDDYQLKATVALRENETLAATFLASDDHLQRTQPSPDPAATRRETVDASFYRAYLRYTRLLPDGSSVAVTPWFGYDASQRATAFGPAPTRLDWDAYSYGLRAGWRGRAHRRVTIAVGVDWMGARTGLRRSGSLTLPPREGDVTVFGQPPGSDVNSDRWSTHISDLGPYVAAEVRLGPVTLTPGLRFDAFLMEGSHATPPSPNQPSIGFTRFGWALDPRLSVSWRAHPRLLLTAATGLYHQTPDPEDLSAVFGNPTLGLSRAAHVSLAAQVRVTGTLTIEAVGFYKYLDELVVRNPAPTPPVGQALVQVGSGQSYGGQLLVRQELWKNLFGWVTYSVSRSERRASPTAADRLFDFDQTHVLGVVASYEYRGWGFGVRFRYASGFPRTPVTGAFYDGASARFQPIFGAQNSIRIPDFVQLDVRFDKTFTFRRLALNIYLDVQNVTYQRNAEEIVYSHDFSRRDYITGLPTLAVLGVRLQF